MPRIHILSLICWSANYIYGYSLVWNGKELSTVDTLDSFRSRSRFRSRKRFFVNCFYCLPLTFLVLCIHERRKQLERQVMQPQRAPEQGELGAFRGWPWLWVKVFPNMPLFMFSNCVWYVYPVSLSYLSDCTHWWARASFCISFQLKCAANCMLHFECYFSCWWEDAHISGKELCDKAILVCVIAVNLHIVIMIIIADFIPATVLLWGLQEDQERVSNFDGMDIASLHMHHSCFF